MYSKNCKANALAAFDAADGNISKAARIARVPERTLNSWVRKYHERRSPAPRDADEVRAAREKARAQLADRFEELAQRCLDEVTDAKLESASVRELILGSAIAVDKMRLLREQAPPPGRSEVEMSEAVKLAAQSIVKMAAAAGQVVTEEQALAKIREIQLGGATLTSEWTQ